MASEFVRCIKNVRDINKLSENVTEENDIISDVNGNIYIRKNVGYHKLYDGDGINVDERLDEIVADIESVEKDLNKIDLTIYAKKSDLVEYLKEDDLTLYAKKSDLDNHPTKSDLTLYAKFSDLDTYAKKSDLAVYVKVTDLNDYAKKSELPDLSTYAKKNDIPNTENWQKHQLTQDDGYIRIVTKPSLLPQDLDNLIDKVGMVYVTTPTGSPHTSGASGFVKSIFRSEGYGILEFQPYSAKNIYQIRRTTSGWGNWYEITTPDLTPYAKKTDIPSPPDLTQYAKESELNPLAIGSEFVSSGAATQELIDNAPTGIQYFTQMIGVNEHQSSNAGYLITFVRSNFKKQLWLPYNTTNHLTRYYDGTSWSDWEKQLSQRDFDNLQAQIDELKA